MDANQEGGLLRAADSGAPGIDMEIYYRDNAGQRRSFGASGRRGGSVRTAFCVDHFVAHGICIDCSRAMGEPVRAS